MLVLVEQKKMFSRICIFYEMLTLHGDKLLGGFI